jgi:hypothetical protein
VSLVFQQSGLAVRLRPIAITLVAALALALGWPVAATAASPTATVVVADSFLAAGETSLVTITFSEKVAQFTVNDMVAQSGTLGGLATTDDVTFTATLTPNADASNATNVVLLNLFGVTDLGAVPGSTVVQSNSYRVDTRRPTAAVVVSDTALSIGETSPVTITFSEAVRGLTAGDFSVENGTIGSVTSSDGGITWTALLEPAAGVTDPANVITLDNTGFSDDVGNIGTGTTTSNSYAVSTARPTATITSSDTALVAGETAQITIVFSEAVAGFTTSDLTVENGTLAALSSSDGATYTATLTPAANTTDNSNAITLALAGVTNAAGNAGTGTAVSGNYTVNTARPTATIAVADADLAAGETSPVTITFSEAVAGFSDSDLTVENGTLSAMSSTDGGVTFTAILTPTFGVTDATNVITLDLSGLQNASGNTGTGTTTSNNYAVTAALMLMITVVDDALAAGQTSVVTFRFSRSVTGFTNADVTVSGGTLSAVTSADGGVTFTATLTPTANSSSRGNSISVDLAGVTDSATNAPGSGVAMSNVFVLDTVAVAATPAARLLAATGAQASGILITGLLLLLLGAGASVARRRQSRA